MVMIMKNDTAKVNCKNIFKSDKPNKKEFNRLFIELIINSLKNSKNIKKH